MLWVSLYSPRAFWELSRDLALIDPHPGFFLYTMCWEVHVGTSLEIYVIDTHIEESEWKPLGVGISLGVK